MLADYASGVGPFLMSGVIRMIFSVALPKCLIPVVMYIRCMYVRQCIIYLSLMLKLIDSL